LLDIDVLWDLGALGTQDQATQGNYTYLYTFSEQSHWQLRLLILGSYSGLMEQTLSRTSAVHKSSIAQNNLSHFIEPIGRLGGIPI